MTKKLLLSPLFIALLLTKVYAMHCPLPSQLKHVPGQPWTLDPVYLNNGWSISSTSEATHNALTSMPENYNLYVQLYPQNKSPLNTATCTYHILGQQYWAVWVSNSIPYDATTVPVPPFQNDHFEKVLGFRCDTVVSNAKSCYWG